MQSLDKKAISHPWKMCNRSNASTKSHDNRTRGWVSLETRSKIVQYTNSVHCERERERSWLKCSHTQHNVNAYVPYAHIQCLTGILLETTTRRVFIDRWWISRASSSSRLWNNLRKVEKTFFLSLFVQNYLYLRYYFRTVISQCLFDISDVSMKYLFY